MKKMRRIELMRMVKASPVIFLLIAILVTMSVAIYTGMRFCGYSVVDLGNRYFSAHDLFDMKIESALGFSEKDILDIKGLEDIKNAQGFYSTDEFVMLGNKKVIAQIFSETPGINTPEVKEGAMPLTNSECAIERQYAELNGIRIGDFVEVKSERLKENRLQVSAIVETPLLVTRNGQNMHGSSRNGDGEILLYLIVTQDSFQREVFFDGYSGVYITFEKNKAQAGFHSEAYQSLYKRQYLAVQKLGKMNSEARLECLSSEFPQISAGKTNPDWKIFSTESNFSFLRHSQSMNSLDSIAVVISGIFILVSIVVCYSTIYGMIHDDKVLVGMQKALGFSNLEIYLKYIRFGLFSAFCGVAAGILLGVFVLEKLTYSAVFGDTYIFSGVQLSFRLPIILLFALIICFIIVFASIMACRQIVKTPAHILVSGSESAVVLPAFLEKKPHFQSLPLDLKIVFRNVLSEKKNFLTVLICVIGCMILMGVSMSIKNGMTKVPEKQYKEIQVFDRIASFRNSASEEEKEEMLQALQGIGVANQEILANYMLAFKKDELYNAAELTVGSAESILSMYRLLDLKGKKMSLPSEGILISRKIHEVYGFEKGDKITLTAVDGRDYSFEISGVFEYYIGHKLFCTPQYYEKVTGTKIFDSGVFICSGEISGEKISELLSGFASFQYLVNTEEKGAFLIELASITEEIVVILIIFAVILSLSVLLNLSFMNIRRKNNEIAIMRLLGFEKVSVFFYTVRETYLAALLGILLSYPLIGVITRYATRLSEVKNYQYYRSLSPECYLTAAVITAGFTAFVSLLTVRRIREINVNSIKR